MDGVNGKRPRNRTYFDTLTTEKTLIPPQRKKVLWRFTIFLFEQQVSILQHIRLPHVVTTAAIPFRKNMGKAAGYCKGRFSSLKT